MGWSFSWDTKHGKQDEINRLLNWQRSDDAVWPLLDHRVVGNHLWLLVRHRETQEVSIALYLLKSGYPQHGWGHKSVSETDAVDVPLSLLDQLPPTDCPRHTEWRESVRRYHRTRSEKRKLSRSIKVGDMFVWSQDGTKGRLVVEREHADGRHFNVRFEIERKGQWWHCQQYRAKGSRLAALEPYVDTVGATTEQAQDQQETATEQQALFA